MDVMVSVFALAVAMGCATAIVLASRKDRKKEKGG